MKHCLLFESVSWSHGPKIQQYRKFSTILTTAEKIVFLCNFITLLSSQAEKKTFFVIPEEIAIQERTSFFTNLFMGYTT